MPSCHHSPPPAAGPQASSENLHFFVRKEFAMLSTRNAQLTTLHSRKRLSRIKKVEPPGRRPALRAASATRSLPAVSRTRRGEAGGSIFLRRSVAKSLRRFLSLTK